MVRMGRNLGLKYKAPYEYMMKEWDKNPSKFKEKASPCLLGLKN